MRVREFNYLKTQSVRNKTDAKLRSSVTMPCWKGYVNITKSDRVSLLFAQTDTKMQQGAYSEMTLRC